ncbi:RNA exonuclease 1 homolog isoform X2 [Centropristis striata]|uniref:RNA exonuclease 1 homolog isoform X2 n=1 Tax=Centropristis striata TaxID=184440 RepID=UPI0027DF3428|nr:RNA exonuclease 1 homolog isoform X2 [Centropristis striata]
MFPSSGLFAVISCPFTKSGLCERPHCLYKHAEDLRTFGASNKSSIVNAAAVQNGYAVNDETKDDCFQELERINKEIETVRHEVEQEQRRLSHYQTVQADSVNTAPDFTLSESETIGKQVHRGPPGLSSQVGFTKTYPREGKYVIDNSKPRTDLEYDPLSNFSAGFRSYSSSGKEQKVRKKQGLKRTSNPVPVDDDFNDAGELIIDIPSSPNKKRARAKKPVDSVVGKSLQDNVEEVKTSPPASTIEENRVHSSCSAESPLNLNENKECDNKPVDRSVLELSGCFEELQSKSQKIICIQAAETIVKLSPEPANPPATTEQQNLNRNNLVVEKEESTFHVELPQCELPVSVKKMNPMQQQHTFPSKNSIFYQAPVANLASPCRQHTKQAQAAQNSTSNQLSSTKCVPLVLPHSQKTSSKMPGQMQGEAAAAESYLQPAEQGSDSSPALAQNNTTASSLPNGAKSTKRLFVTEDTKEVIVISSSSGDEDELNYSDIELSDSDPMEECYRIFMEANNEVNGNEEQPDTSVGAMDVEKPELNVKPQATAGKKRIAHEAKHTEPAAKSRPQPQVLVPLRGPVVSGFPSQPSTTSKIQQVQQRASVLAASVKGGQAFVSATCQKKPEIQSSPVPSTQTPENLQPAVLQQTYQNYISFGTAVIGVGDNLHLILPDGSFPLPVTSSTSQVTSVLTPIGKVHTSTVAVRQMYHPPSVTSVQRYRTTAPVLIPAPARKPLPSAAGAAAASTAPQPPVHTAFKPVPTKRKLKQQYEAKDKVSHQTRQHYVNMFTEEFLKSTANVNDAFEKALAEEKAVYNRSVNQLKYLSVAVNALKRLKNQSVVAAKDENKVNSQRSKGNIPLNLKKFKGNDDMALYECLMEYILNEEKLVESNFPVQHPEKPGGAVLFVDNKKVNTDPLKRICCRCGATYSVNQSGKHIRKEECNYHYGKGVTKRVPGGMETRYSCCEGVMGAPGCQVFKLHVHDALSLDGFVSTVPRHPSDTSCPGVYSLDCEMCYTIHGLELSRVTVVNSNLQVVYDTFVRPDNEVIDYNTRFSGISEEDVKGHHTSLKEVQETLLSFINADTILIGHGPETNFCTLKLLHGTVVDTSVVFPHRLGPPHKLTLNKLTTEYLRRIIQESVCGHDPAEDAAACMELMLWKAKEDGKLKK